MTTQEQASERRQDELMALGAILSSDEFSFDGQAQPKETHEACISSSQHLTLRIPGTLPNAGARVLIRTHIFQAHKALGGLDADYRVEETVLKDICHLPSTQLLLELPDAYPVSEPPTISQVVCEFIGHVSFEADQPQSVPTSLVKLVTERAAIARLDFEKIITRRLRAEWDEVQSETLFWWFETLREAIWTGDKRLLYDTKREAYLIDEFVITDEALSCARRPSHRISSILRTYDLLCKRKNFEDKRFGCGICLEEKRGGKCFRLSSCEHIFCQDCLTGYLSSMIREGYVRQAAACPDPECVKSRVASENSNGSDNDASRMPLKDAVGHIETDELTKIVGKDLVERLDELREKALASADPSAGFCPRPACQRLVRSDPKDVGTAYEAMRQCSCGYTYCLYCSKSWHGNSPCHIVSSTALIEAYQRSAPGSAERRGMELRYGRTNLEKMIKKHEEEQSNRKWMEENTQSCPCCRVRVQKSVGCNHMACKSCNTHFCYRCGTRLPPLEPYKHFNTPGMPCYMKLFDADMTGGGDGGWEAVDGAELAHWEDENI